MLFVKHRIDYWLSRDLWSEADFTMLLAGEDERVYPEGWYDTQEGKDFLSKRNEAAKCISQAVLAKVLPCICPTDASAADKLYGVARYFRPREAITWARSKPTFGDFPFKSLLPNEVGYTSRKVSKAPPPPASRVHSSGTSGTIYSKPLNKETMPFPTETKPPPNWSEWQLVPKLHIWQAVALSLSVDPYTVEDKSLSWFADDGQLRGDLGGYSSAIPPKCMLPEESVEFNTRLKQAMNAAKFDAFEAQRYHGKMHGFSYVIHGHFWKWAKKVGWCIPDEMMNFKSEPTKAEPLMQPHFTKDLELLIQAANYFWKDADQSDKSTLAKKSNPEVAKWLVSRGFSSDSLASKGASIIRPDWAAKGKPVEL